MSYRRAGVVAFASILALVVPMSSSAEVLGTDVTYTTDADFDRGTLVSVNHDAPGNDQLQLDDPIEPFPFINVAASGRGTVVRANTETGEVLGEYRTAPEGYGLDPSRTTVDLYGNVWTANRGESGEIAGVPHGSAVKIGLVVGGTRVDASGAPDPGGGYLGPPFGYNTCIDRDGDGLIRTSSGLLDILDWPDLTDGVGGPDGVVEDADDECILLYQRLPDAEQARHVSVDANNDVWVGGFPFELRQFHLLHGTTGAIIDSFDARDFGCGGYGGLVDGNGIVWSIGWGWGEGPLLRYDPVARTGMCVNTFGGYGLGIDTNGYVWASIWENGIVKVAPDGTVEPGYPKSTWQPPAPAPAAIAALRTANAPAPAVVLLADDAPEEAPDFWAAPGDQYVSSMTPWLPGVTISLMIEDGSGVVHIDSMTSDGDGNFQFNFGDPFRLERGHLVTVSDGTDTKSHTVTDLYVDGFDLSADTVFGRAVAGTTVEVWVHETTAHVTATADGSGNWTADFSGQTDLTLTSNGGSGQYDADGDATGVWWASPSFTAAPDDDWIGSMSHWKPDTSISLTIEDGTGVVYTDSQVSDGSGHFNFNLWDVFDFQRGHIVTVSDGVATKSHTVTNLFVDGIDVTADTVYGRADAGTDVEVWVHETDANVIVMSDGSGNWTADFSATADLDFGSNGGSQQRDDDGDSTGVWWSGPTFVVTPDDDGVGSSSRWTAGATVSLTIEDGSGVIYTDSQVVDPQGNFGFNLLGVFDVQRGHTVTVAGNGVSKTHVVANYFVDGVDIDADTVFGRADPGTDVHVWEHQTDANVTATADGSGNWTADFSGLADLTANSDGNSQQVDDDGDATWVFWSLPSFVASPDHDWVGSRTRWLPGSTVSLTIVDGSGVIYTDSQTVDAEGNFNFNLGEVFDLQRGHTVTVSDGTTTKTHEVLELFVDSVDTVGDIVTGHGIAGERVDVSVHDEFGSGVSVVADGAGNWTADFSGVADIIFQSNGDAQQYDADGDATTAPWQLPSISVAPDMDWVQSVNPWAAGVTVTLAIERPLGNEVFDDSQTTDQDGYFNFELSGTFDVLRGDTVIVSDGSTTKTHVVHDLFVDVIDVTEDDVFGRAEAGAGLHLWLHEHDVNIDLVADGSGDWVADLTGIFDLDYRSAGGVAAPDDDGDATEVHWRLPQFVVDLDYEQIRGDGWTPNAALAVTVDGVPVPGVVTNEYGDFEVGAEFDLVSGQLVEVTGPVYAKTLLLGSPEVTNVDPAADMVVGTAAPEAMLDVWAARDFWSEPSFRTVTADVNGDWIADFSVPVDDWPALDLVAGSPVTTYEWDDDGDATIRNFGPPIQANRGVAVTPVDNNVWVANSGVGTVTRLDNDGNVLAVVDVGDAPTGVAVDAAGKVWVTNLGSDNVMRIDPSANVVDLTVDLGEGAAPYNYSDMTGAVVVGSTSPQGFWTVVQDSGQRGFEWGRITWNTEAEGHVPVGAEIIVEARTADTPAGLGAAVFAPVGNGELFLPPGRYIEVRVTLKASPEGFSPILSDIRVQPHVIGVDVDIKPGSDPNSINTKRGKGVIPVAVLGSAEFDVMTIDVTTLRFGPSEAAPAHDVAKAGGHYEDVDFDGYLDLVSHYTVGDTGLAVGDTEACLTGATFDAIPIEGCDAVRIVK